VLLDETGVTTSMTGTHGRAPKGARWVAAVPGGQWQSTTFIAGLRLAALTAPMVLDGPMDGAAFPGYVRNFWCPTLQPGDIVSADNLPSHKVAGIKQTIEAAGASLRHLPAYSPDFNPIENLFAKLKALLNKAAHRTHPRGALAGNR
jgi:transposase